MSGGKSSTGFNRAGGGTADGRGGFAPASGATLADGTTVREVFDEVEDALKRLGYEKVWVDGWKREADGAVVTVSYSYREVRVRRYRKRNGQGGPQAIRDVRCYEDLGQIESFVGCAVEYWDEQVLAGVRVLS